MMASGWWIVRAGDGGPISGPFGDVRWARIKLKEWERRIPGARLVKVREMTRKEEGR